MKKNKKTRKGVNPMSRIEEELLAHEMEVSPWRILRIMSEFTSGFDFLRHYQKAVTFFGSARRCFPKEYYEEATKLAYELSKQGFAIVTGGGPGFMEAANKGAHEAGGASVGIAIKLEHEQEVNPHVNASESFSYLFTRKTMLAYASQFYIFFPGGMGTLDELFELITLVQTKKIDPIPIILVNREYWTPLLNWIKEALYEKYEAIGEQDMDIYTLVDDADEALELIETLKKKGEI